MKINLESRMGALLPVTVVVICVCVFCPCSSDWFRSRHICVLFPKIYSCAYFKYRKCFLQVEHKETCYHRALSKNSRNVHRGEIWKEGSICSIRGIGYSRRGKHNLQSTATDSQSTENVQFAFIKCTLSKSTELFHFVSVPFV